MGNEYINRLGEKYLMGNFSRQPIACEQGRGLYMQDAGGNEYLDFVTGLAVNALGHCDPAVVDAVAKQSGKLIHCSNLYWSAPQAELAQLLVEHSCLDRVFFCNSGTEANEAAIKLARRYFQTILGESRSTIITFSKSFHGRTIAAATATAQESIHSGFDPLPGGFAYLPFNDIEALQAAMDDSICAVLLEPVQGEGGVNTASADILKQVRELCDKYGALLILDEIQCGMGRTGTLFAYEHYGIQPDIVTLAKALGGGLPLGAVLAAEEICRAFGPGSHGSTFGGNPVCCAAGIAVIETLLGKGFLENVKDMGAYLKGKLTALAEKYDFITEVRGQGLMFGVELAFPGGAIVEDCREKGLLINCAAKSVIRLLPPLNVTTRAIDQAAAILEEVLGEHVQKEESHDG